MSVHSPDRSQFFLTEPNACPYLDGRVERKIFTHLVGPRARATHEELTAGGFRRSQHIAYRPACPSCRACTAVRVPVDTFRPTRSQKRILKKNAHLIGEVVGNAPTSEQYSLFRRYVQDRHGDGEMRHMSVLDYASMVEDSFVSTAMVEYRERGPDSAFTGRGIGELLGVVLFDKLSDGLSMVYSYFDPTLEANSPGKFMILDHIALARRMGLPFCHLGFYVEGSRKMQYKAQFQPQQHLTPAGWKNSDTLAANRNDGLPLLDEDVARAVPYQDGYPT